MIATMICHKRWNTPADYPSRSCVFGEGSNRRAWLGSGLVACANAGFSWNLHYSFTKRYGDDGSRD